MTDLPPGIAGITPLRPPEVEEVDRGWRSRWSLRFEREPEQRALARVQDELPGRLSVLDVSLTHLHDLTYRLELTSQLPPMEVESYPSVDLVLLTVDEQVAPLLQVNDSPRDDWRTFRNRKRRTPG
jgi:hypothetical protein